jgi:glycosyltransferase involved in cell wall biosynthesis
MSSASTDATRVLYYTESTLRGGAETCVANLLAALGPNYEVTVVGVAADVVEWIAASRRGTATRVLPRIGGETDVRAMRALRRAVVQSRPHVFQADLVNIWGSQWPLLVASTVRGVAPIAVEHTPFETTPSRAKRWLKRLVDRRLAAHVAVGDALARHVEARASLPPDSIRVIPPGVPDAPVEPGPRVADGAVIGTVARLDALKGVDVLVRATASLPGVSLVVVGDGVEAASLRALTGELGISGRVHFVGWSDEPRAWMSSFDVFVLPSLMEGRPLTISEAMLAGVPVVATDVGSVRELVDGGRTGVLVPAHDVDRLAHAVRGLLDDVGARRALADHARSFARQELTAQRMARRYEALYSEVRRA